MDWAFASMVKLANEDVHNNTPSEVSPANKFISSPDSVGSPPE